RSRRRTARKEKIRSPSNDDQVKEQKQHVRRRERQQEKDPRRRIEDIRLRIREPRLAAGVVRIPKRHMARAELLGGEPAEGLEVVEVIAEGEDLLFEERGEEERCCDEGDEGEGETVADEGRRQKAEGRSENVQATSAFCPLPSAFCLHLVSQNPRTIALVSRTPSAKNRVLILSSTPCT